MAKKSTKRSSSKKSATKRKSRPRIGSLNPYQQLLLDPCNGPVASYYAGESGIVQRFVLDRTINIGTTATCGYQVYSPAANQGVAWDGPTASTPGSPVAFSGPGAAYLAANAKKIRSVASCVTVIPSALSYNNLTGEIAMANISYDTIPASGTFTVDGIFQLTTARSVLAKQTYECKWAPQTLDGTYNGVTALGTAALGDPSDHNAILIAYRGFPAGVPLSIRVTTVIEWTPGANLGLAVTSIPRAPHNYMAASADLFNRSPHWWTNVMGDVGNHLLKEVGKGVKALGSFGVQQAVRYGVSNFPMLAM